ncbi:hypothetical protein NQ318_002507 [Aromia moschata]|uniref:Uncharacterized protein n=1 Tax=Aromia moschata TaxID=1265417 RepID=A0AAV8Y6R5_9CUCU|nr:hypothetical protein NQ318_002507 [Aromia moschata]
MNWKTTPMIQTISPVFGLFSSCSPQYRRVSKLSSTSTNIPESSAVKPKLKACSSVQLQTPEKESSSLGDQRKISLDLSLCTISTPESSQTDSDDVSPQINRKRKNCTFSGYLTKFSISVEGRAQQSRGRVLLLQKIGTVSVRTHPIHKLTSREAQIQISGEERLCIWIVSDDTIG